MLKTSEERVIFLRLAHPAMYKSLARCEPVPAVVGETSANELLCIARDVFIWTEAGCLRVNGVVFVVVIGWGAILNSNVTAVVTKNDAEITVNSALAGEVEMTKVRKFLESREKLKAKHPNGPDVGRQ